ncbi:hypothetical protein [Flavobacterium geliluteum]|uniref:Uncharacterized protein n=1 Tax=Flavobacterium geliluteum TaxID=2816120 RepID=A0A940XDJ4_9FLAO|nr:hypothetical protein [Flavobacterium geliluteum]MBP4139971.1 hypothetical protein [Flavobacterium geliluteum]
MILGFSTKIKDKPTYFVEKIDRGLIQEGLPLLSIDKDKSSYAYDIGKLEECFPKIHTIREDKNDRWKKGNKIDFFINVRQKNMFRFAPVLPVVSTQKVMIVWYDLFGKLMVRVFIDGKSFATVKFADKLIITGNILELAQNDGFDTVAEFFEYFNEDFKGKIIHWTDKQY